MNNWTEAVLLPLKYYDDAGRIKPSANFWLVILLICKVYLIFAAALGLHQDSSSLLRLFYPSQAEFYWQLMGALPALAVFFLCGFREKLWSHQVRAFVYLIKPLLMLSILLNLTIDLYTAHKQFWAFSWHVGISLFLNLSLLLYVLLSKHLSFMLHDWKRKL